MDPGTPGGTRTVTIGINSSGRIAGQSSPANGRLHGLLIDGGVVVGVDNLIDPMSGFTTTARRGINSSGRIVADGVGSGGLFHAYLRSPVPEPSSPAPFAVGLGSVAATKVLRARKARGRTRE